MNEHTKIMIIIVALFILAFSLRINMLGEKSFFEPDMFFESRQSWDVLNLGHVQNPDNLAYYQISPLPPQQNNPLWNINAVIYTITIQWWGGINKDLFTQMMQILPAIFGALTCLVLYFVGKAGSGGNKVIGLITMFVAAVTSGFLYRQMIGAQVTNSFGFLPFSLGLLFLLWALNEKTISKKSIIFSIISGGLFFFMVTSWSQYLIIPLILLGFWLYHTISSFMDTRDKTIIRADLLHFIIIFSLFWVGTTFMQFNWINSVAVFMNISILYMNIFVGVVLFGCSVLFYFGPTLNEAQKKVIKWIIAIGFILVIIGIFYFTTLNIDPRDLTSLGSMVGESSVGHNFFLQKFNIFNILTPLAFLGAAILFIWKGNKYKFMPLFLAGFTLLFVMGFLTLKFCYDLGFGMAFAIIIITMLFYELLEYMKDKNKLEMKIIFVPALCILLFGISAAGGFIQDYNTALASDPSLAAVVDYFNTSTPSDAKILNTWSYGHVLSYSTGRAVSSDNRNYSPLANAQFSMFENDSNSQKVYQMVLDMNTDYILVGKSDFYSMQVNEFYIAGKINGILGTEFTKPLIQIIECGRNGTILSCNGNNFDESQIPKSWVSVPTQFYNGQYPLFIYLYKDSLVILNAAANNTNLAKVFFGTPETDKFYSRAFETPAYLVLKVNK